MDRLQFKVILFLNNDIFTACIEQKQGKQEIQHTFIAYLSHKNSRFYIDQDKSMSLVTIHYTV